ncbi:hypothetical protein [Autumnicola musiva]|uniref:Addiction module component n=1 Tax=Autumnicola musiva TaxID=3075589 RepID=A0ABU3D176_9FLAO|nr:hypothetical protein [Zunongwangia sp. F117]MDT0675295.1 hypothetical protein [Zunongwangia sp. F117]
MNMNQLKIELLQGIINCNNEELLKEVEGILKSFPSEVKEAPQYYSKEEDISNLTENQIMILEKRYQSYLKGGSKAETWENVIAEIRKEHGF